MFLILRKPRTPWSFLRMIISKRNYFKRDAETSRPAEMSHPCNAVHVTTDITIHAETAETAQPSDIHAAHSPRRDTLCSKDIDAIVNQLAALAETVSQSSHRSTTQSERSSSCTRPDSPATKKTEEEEKDEEEEEESFGYLRSLITVSEHSSASSVTDDSDGQPTGRRRASSRLSLRFGELSFPKVSRNPCPRYTPMPPAWTPKPVATRPEVRF